MEDQPKTPPSDDEPGTSPIRHESDNDPDNEPGTTFLQRLRSNLERRGQISVKSSSRTQRDTMQVHASSGYVSCSCVQVITDGCFFVVPDLSLTDLEEHSEKDGRDWDVDRGWTIGQEYNKGIGEGPGDHGKTSRGGLDRIEICFTFLVQGCLARRIWLEFTTRLSSTRVGGASESESREEEESISRRVEIQASPHSAHAPGLLLSSLHYSRYVQCLMSSHGSSISYPLLSSSTSLESKYESESRRPVPRMIPSPVAREQQCMRRWSIT